MTKSIPRPEHPRPQFERDSWLSLNGTWTCRIKRQSLGQNRPITLPNGEDRSPPPVGPYDQQIVVPFAPESPLSGIGHQDFIDAIDYHRSIEIPAAWEGKRVLLHFGAVDFHADVFIAGSWAGSHSGGSSPFSLDITELIQAGASSDLTVAVVDYINSGNQPGGKQSHYAQSHGCFYTRTTGIWQTVWLEAVSPAGLADLQIIPDVSAGGFALVPRYQSIDPDAKLRVTLSRDEQAQASITAECHDGIPISVLVPDPQLWWPGAPALYDILAEVIVGDNVVDSVRSYAGLREVTLREGKFFINGSSVYLRLVLDQGFYPDGTWTAPSDADLRRDIELSMAAGFNGARLHQKVFEDRFHYWADRLGYLTWSEWPSWGFDYNDYLAARTFENEIREVVAYLRNHPSIIAWTPFNETLEYRNPRSHYLNHTDAYWTCKQLDPTRPVNDASGYVHHITDIYTVHSYRPTAEDLHEQLAPQTLPDGNLNPFRNFPNRDRAYAGQPYLVDEFGGIKWVEERAEDENENRKDPTKAWGYGGTPRTQAEFFDRLTGLVDTLIGFEHIAGWCYTQLTDVEQEQNGVYFYDRSPKFAVGLWKRQFSRKPDGYDR